MKSVDEALSTLVTLIEDPNQGPTLEQIEQIGRTVREIEGRLAPTILELQGNIKFKAIIKSIIDDMEYKIMETVKNPGDLHIVGEITDRYFKVMFNQGFMVAYLMYNATDSLEEMYGPRSKG